MCHVAKRWPQPSLAVSGYTHLLAGPRVSERAASCPLSTLADPNALSIRFPAVTRRLARAATSNRHVHKPSVGSALPGQPLSLAQGAARCTEVREQPHAYITQPMMMTLRTPMLWRSRYDAYATMATIQCLYSDAHAVSSRRWRPRDSDRAMKATLRRSRLDVDAMAPMLCYDSHAAQLVLRHLTARQHVAQRSACQQKST